MQDARPDVMYAAMSDYYTALKAWQSGQNAPGDNMPEGFRIRPALKRSPEHVAALGQVRDWTRARFKLPEEAAVAHVYLSELALDEGHLHALLGHAGGEKRSGLAGSDNDSVEALHDTAPATSTAPTTAAASSMRAAGRSLPNEAASRLRAAAPP